LAAFTGGAPLSALEAVLQSMQVPPDAGLDIITRLVDRSLATADIRPRGPARYDLLDSVRAFSLERLREAGLLDAAAAAHAAWYAEAADRASIGVRGPGQPEHLSLARAERANIDAAMAWSATHDPAMGVRIALGFGWTWVVLGTGVEGSDKVRAALAAASPNSHEQAAALTLCGWFEASGGNLESAGSDLQEAIHVGDERARAIARLHLAFVHTQGGRARDALDLLDACREDLTRFDLVWEQGASWLLSAWAHLALGDVPAGQAACDRALTLLRPVGDSWALAHAEGLLGELAQAQHRFTDATVHLAAAADAAGTLGFEAAQAHHLLNLGRALHQAGDSAGSQSTLARAVDIGQRCGDARTVAFARTRSAQVLRVLGDIPAALDRAQKAVDWYKSAGGGDGALLANHLLAALHADVDAPSAREELTQVLMEARAAADAGVEILTLDALADLDARHGRLDDAKAERAAAELVLSVSPMFWPGDRVNAAGVAATLEV
jgi:tetratricopeptide (TPR) repeat protein